MRQHRRQKRRYSAKLHVTQEERSMCSRKEVVVIEGTHRWLIFFLSLAGLYIGDTVISKGLLTISLGLWIWSPQWVRFEITCLNTIRGDADGKAKS